ncbi:uncharacterized protein SETTUDRAFT_183058 [Exserohilum turcica Et28A]|uniref:Secreted protein n=1 Tax=Exserohilum turcicum (strain 28A) TaxID=671987 RepID=R0IYS6_EXST2|nr:uncharacterized protein SETTUDRAFT_183058 [Exserohilum turcica Et28A]EOA89686.1 hypothetical protein SETTUDRAFT_183058 [Exserohilum turcica Et28A]
MTLVRREHLAATFALCSLLLWAPLLQMHSPPPSPSPSPIVSLAHRPGRPNNASNSISMGTHTIIAHPSTPTPMTRGPGVPMEQSSLCTSVPAQGLHISRLAPRRHEYFLLFAAIDCARLGCARMRA